MVHVCSVRSSAVTSVVNGEDITQGLEINKELFSAKQSFSEIGTSGFENLINSQRNNNIGGRGGI